MRKIKYFTDCDKIYLRRLEFINKNNMKTKRYNLLQQQWVNFRNEYKNKLKIECPYPDEVEDVIIGKFKDLVKIYIDYLKNDIKNNHLELHELAKNIFNYDESKTPQNNTPRAYLIGKFFLEHEELGLTTCFYCDGAYINHFTDVETYRMYDLDHFIEKADCPILATSLYNLVPSCQICNSKVKGSRDPMTQYGITNINELEKYLIHLSPTSPYYDFENNVTFEINTKDIDKENDFDNLDNFEIELYTTNKYSKADIKGFMLKTRYNYKNTKAEAINIFRLKKKYPDNYISEISSTLANSDKKIIISEDEIKEDIFHLDSDLKNHRIYSKMKEDIITK